jgi:hypothetical protein
MRPEPIHRNPHPIGAVLERAVTRLRLRDGIRATAVAAVLAAAVHAGLTIAGVGSVWRIGLSALAVTASVWLTLARSRRERTARGAANAIERAEPSLRNLVFTAAQLLESPEGVRAYMRERVFREASTRASMVDLRRAVPLSGDVLVLIAAIVIAGALSFAPLPAASRAATSEQGSPAGAPQVTASDLVIDLTPPQYSGRPASRLVNPGALDVLAGTAAIVRPPAGDVRIRVNGAVIPRNADGAARLVLTESGYMAVDGAAQRLLPLTVTPDGAPSVKITAPAKDLRVPSSAITIPIAASADDDLGLAAFDLRYTIVSGTGEQFTFTEGTLPSAVQRGSDRSWRLDARLALAALRLEPGDALIYRAVAADRRPGGAGVATSDTFFVEVAGPGDVPLEGIEMPPERERYALSQAMIVLKLERLQARERTLTKDALTEEAGNIGAEQRAVRANFVFLLGGEIEDEEVEAEHSHEISEGRFANQARKDIVAATVLMGQVEKALAAISTRDALPPARAAVKALQRAFGHSRYLLRALPSRVRLDPARRLTGDTTSAGDWDRVLSPPAPDPAIASARTALGDVIAAAAGLDAGADAASLTGTLRALSERILGAAANAPDLRPAAAEIATARTALAEGRRDAARDALQRAAVPLVKRAQQGRIEGHTVPGDAARLAGAAALPRGGGKP